MWTGAAQALSEAHIMVIDDEPLNTAALEAFLRGARFSRVASLSGREVSTQALRNAQPDLLLIELELADGRAFEVLRWMHDDRLLRHVPVIVLTAQDDLASRLRALELGAADVLVKPIDAGELDLRLRNILAAKAYRDQLAYTDPVTGLPNRESLLWRLDWAVKQALRQRGVGAVLQIGLDRFTQVNDALGPAIGDDLLHAVSRRLMAGLRDSDVVTRAQTSRATAVLSRGSGDEFAVLLPAIEQVDDAAVVAKRMIDRLVQPFAVAGHELFVSCRVGIAVFPHDSADKDTVLKHAGVAMRSARLARQTASSGFQYYSAELNSQAVHRISLERELHHALDRDELKLHYQGQVDAVTGRLCGAEALVRWEHPRLGLLGPDAFIPLAEETGQIVRLGDWVLREALRQLAVWRRDGMALQKIAVNVSSLQLQRAELCDDVRAALDAAGVDATGLSLELTESAIIDSRPQVTETLESIKRLGVQLALDDFGTGYSSLTHLCRFPIDELKIDRSFVTDCDRNAHNSAITAAIIAMARRLGLRVVAEGVETPQQLAFVRASGADAFQGFLFARPMPAAEFGALLPLSGAQSAGLRAAALMPAAPRTP